MKTQYVLYLSLAIMLAGVTMVPAMTPVDSAGAPATVSYSPTPLAQTIQGGNVTTLPLTPSGIGTTKWAGFLGTITAPTLILSDATATNLFYNWAITTEGDVCAGQANNAYTWRAPPIGAITTNTAASLDAAFSFTPADPDSAINTFLVNNANCNAGGAYTMEGDTYGPAGIYSADTGPNTPADTFCTYLLYDSTPIAPATDSYLFCTDTQIFAAGTGYDGTTPTNYELIVPIVAGVTETYYFYMSF